MVGKTCTVCRNSSYNDKKYSFFTYPGDPKRRYKWLKAVDRLDLLRKLENNKTRSNHRICEAHFEQKYVKRSTVSEGRKFLSKDAFPTLFLDGESSPGSVFNPFVKRRSKRRVNVEHHSSRDDEKNEIESNIPIPFLYTDVSELCESVIKVSKGTQTATGSNIEMYEDSTENTMKAFKTDRYSHSDKKESFLQSCYQFLPESITQIIKWHLYKKNNCSLNLFAINLYFSSNSYNLLRNMLSLPTVENLKQFLIPRNTHVSANFLNALKSKINCMSHEERICSFSVGCTLMKPCLYYDIQFDRIIGFHDMDGEQITKPAKYAVILMLQGILYNWTQPVAYTFISEYDNFPEISLWIDEVMLLLINIGLDIRVFISDPRSEFLYSSESRFVTADQPYFSINGRNIYYIYDTSQLLKIVKNNLKSCNFHYDSKVTDNSITVDFIDQLDKLYSILNSKTQTSNSQFNKAFCNEKFQINYLMKMLNLFKHLKVIRKVDGVDVTENMKFVQCFQITIKSVLQLFNELVLLGAKYLLTSRLTLSCVHKFFNRMKQKNCKEECTPRQFNRFFKRSLILNLMKKPLKYPASSLGEDILQEFLDVQHEEAEGILNKPLAIATTDYKIGLPDKNAFNHVSEYCYMKCLQRHCCDELRDYLRIDESFLEQNCDSYQFSDTLDLYMKNETILPPDSFIAFILLLEETFKEYFKPDAQINSVGQELFKEMENCVFNTPCQCFPVDYLKALFIRVRIYYTIRANNKAFRRKGVKSFQVYDL